MHNEIRNNLLAASFFITMTVIALVFNCDNAAIGTGIIALFFLFRLGLHMKRGSNLKDLERID